MIITNDTEEDKFSLKRNELMDAMGKMPSGLNGIIDTVVTLNKNIFSLKDLIFGIELKKAAEKIKNFQGEWQLLLLQVLYNMSGNERIPIVFQTHLVKDEKSVKGCKAANWAYYFIKNDKNNSNIIIIIIIIMILAWIITIVKIISL